MAAEYDRALSQVRPGFVLVNDQREARDFSDEAIEVGAQMVIRTGERGVSHVIRIKPEAPAMRIRVTRVLITARAAYVTELAGTLEEAERRVSARLTKQQNKPG